MELGFTVPRAGPLAQVSLHIISLETAIHLTQGAYGWWKARERSQSLVAVLEAAKSQLISTSSFNWRAYQKTRESSALRAIVVQSGQLQSATLPKASTSLPSNVGLACVRALLATLLCYYDVEACTVIMAEVIPKGLLQYDQEDSILKFEGPLLASLKHMVSAVATEEDSSNFRQYLLEQVARQQILLTGASTNEILQCETTTICEIPYVVGMIQWVLTPRHMRTQSVYPTRSLLVWAIALALSKVGFDLQTSAVVAGSSANYRRLVASRSQLDCADVVLVTTPCGPTDPLMLNRSVSPQIDYLRPQVAPIQAIPWIIFRREQDTRRQIDTKRLADVWKYSYDLAYEATVGVQISAVGRAKIVTCPTQPIPLTDFQHALLADWNISLDKVCGPAIDKFIPPAENSRAGWDARTIRYAYFELGDRTTSTQVQVQDNCKVMLAIILGALYGLLSKCSFEYGKACFLDTHIAIWPDTIYNVGRLQKWVGAIGHGLNGTLSPADWTDTVLQLMLGKRATDTGRAHVLGPLILGGHFNGVTAISDVLVHPSSDQDSLLRINIQRGILLNIPVSSDGLVLAYEGEQVLEDLVLDPEPNLHHLARSVRMPAPEPLRIDAEPCWENNPEQVVFRVRQKGLAVGTVNINELFHQLMSISVRCSCQKHVRSISVPVSQRWQHVGIHQIIPHLGGRVLIGDDDKIIVDASTSDEALMIAVSCTKARKTKISVSCLQCTYDAFENLEDSESVAIIISNWGHPDSRSPPVHALSFKPM